ncbi:cupredoxin family copper-binding protein [Kitasatospora albolonga]|uniref:cupredoxin domain-containing protein n=1 Tax=Kitasatospora albolonga TaxID=68173 RepID=UPI0031F11308
MHTSPARALIAAAVTVLLMLAVGCSGSTGPTRVNPVATVSTSPPTGETSTASAVNLTIKDFAFAPADLTVAPGTRIVVANQDSAPHTVSATGKAFDTGRVEAGASATFTAPAAPGSYPYLCDIHPFMGGTLTVR